MCLAVISKELERQLLKYIVDIFLVWYIFFNNAEEESFRVHLNFLNSFFVVTLAVIAMMLL